MKQLQIKYRLYSQQDSLISEQTFTTTSYDEMSPSILKNALSLIAGHAKSADGYYTIVEIYYESTESTTL